MVDKKLYEGREGEGQRCRDKEVEKRLKRGREEVRRRIRYVEKYTGGTR